ncbi:thiopurine S-methyltransferase [Colwellia sp. M166]|uniref:thiopurine S-methyltransferase n=1 Tax=Colwellia sp. M166 TaxID=2583805 RepID=UPI00211DD924|nr:thiopurine S-methyltransferase [Colwellia sp. M166]UUO21814.1 thiopurine S-methyltransferase [Colwellia sp. M166]|tara:strand:- start:19423 stop:20076 length:654 start_codon:yes stop_codon:yes gene_type:complete
MKSGFWHNCWERNKLGFHQDDVHPLLTQYFTDLILASDQHVFVPLCGKTHDMAYLAQYMRVTGSELSDIACRDFFIDNDIEYQKQTFGEFKQYSADQLTLYQGDFFKLWADAINKVDWIYDRAALIALPPVMQVQYANHLQTFFSSNTRLFLVTVEFPSEQLTGPPFSLNSVDVKCLFSGFSVECIANHELDNKRFAQRRFEVDYLREKLYIIKKLD